MDQYRSLINNFCAEIGQDSLLVQGAGGNISVKEGDILWIKASGSWIGEAKIRDIFTPVDLRQLKVAIQKNQYDVVPSTMGVGVLKPSIETLLHALMPHKIVLHLHAIEALAYLVQKNALNKINDLIGDSLAWGYIEYHKPGAELAGATHKTINLSPSLNILFLANHGVVIGAANVQELLTTLSLLRSLLQRGLSLHYGSEINISRKSIDLDVSLGAYRICEDLDLNQLATNLTLLKAVKECWALYPDHVVFLGPKPILVKPDEVQNLPVDCSSNAPYIFVEGFGVLESNVITRGQRAQLRCYYDILIRQKDYENLSILSEQQIYELINWDAEKYRQSKI